MQYPAAQAAAGYPDCQKIIFASLLKNLNFQKSSDFFLLDVKDTPPGFLSPYLPSRSFCCYGFFDMLNTLPCCAWQGIGKRYLLP